MTQPKQVTIYTDGSCLGNPGPGGYGVLLRYSDHERELSGGFARTTNNRMEILAAIVGLEALSERCQVALYSDSTYLVNTISRGWAQRWEAKGWKYKNGLRVNYDLWKRLLDVTARHDVQFEWVQGHAGHPDNERVDRLAESAAHGSGLPPDPGYRP